MTENTIQDSDAFQAAWDEPQKSALSQGELDKLTEDLIEALKADGRGWQTRANALLRKAAGL